MQRVKCIGLGPNVGAIHIEGEINAWIQGMTKKCVGFKVLAVDVTVARTFTMATILYDFEAEEARNEIPMP